jgi:hypothetical protein
LIDDARPEMAIDWPADGTPNRAKTGLVGFA